MVAATMEVPGEVEEYRLLRLIGSGAMGRVYLAEDRLLERLVAIKFIAAAIPSERARSRFFQEARAVARLSHPNVVAIYRVAEFRRQPFLVSEYIRGTSLAELEAPVAMKKLLAIAGDLARGLAAAHRQQVLHRDIKPANAMLSEDGVTKLLDFGLAELDPERAADGASAISTPNLAAREAAALHVAGTPLYLAPELWRGEPATPRSDVYALGLLLYELCSGAHPFAGLAAPELRDAAAAWEVRPLAEVAPHVDARFARIVDRCIASTAHRRYSDGNAVREALDALAERERGPRVIPEGAPYRGLVAFDAEHRDVFFGRRAEARTLIERLRSERLLVVAGDSGTGKSSLCRAGVLPLIGDGALGPQVAVASTTLGPSPVLAVAAALARLLGTDERAVAELLVHDSATLGRELRKTGKETILFIDQLEELCTLAGPDEARRVTEAIHALIHTGSVRVMTTARSDFLTRLAALPGLGDELSPALFLLRPLSPERLREAIVAPAEASGFVFESDEVIAALLEQTQRAEGGLPLLQFALAELWEARDEARRVIPGAALTRIGGVAGALARHADGVLAALPSPERGVARTILRALVTAEGTRGRRGHAELIRLASQASPRAAAVLEVLVRGRLLVAQEAKEDGESAYTIAHEALLEGWGTLQGWLDEEAEGRAARQRLEHSAAEWDRLGRPREALWSSRPLSEVANIAEATLALREREFLRAARRAVLLRRAQRVGLVVGFPIALAAVVFTLRLAAARETARRQDLVLAYSQRKRVSAELHRTRLQAARQAAFASFDRHAIDDGTRLWKTALAIAPLAERDYADAEEGLERLLQDTPSRGDARAALGNVLTERAALADALGRAEERDDLVRRLGVYGFGDRWTEPASITISTRPAGATVTVHRYALVNDRWREGTGVTLGTSPVAAQRIAPGSIVLDFALSGRSPVRLPVLLPRAEAAQISVDLPPAGAIPPGFIYVPAGRFLYGSSGEDARVYYESQPIHPVDTGAYLIARDETTYREWIEFLEALPVAERVRRMPSAGRQGFTVILTRSPGGEYTLALGPDARPYTARAGQPIRYLGRQVRASQDWLRMPVTGVSLDDLIAYTKWLSDSHRVPNARPCTEQEWERAARGADGRSYPHGTSLDADDANFDLTYGRVVTAWGPDEVGSHPASDSLFGVHDLVGNAWEWTLSGETDHPAVARGGSFMQWDAIARPENRAPDVATRRDAFYGIRVCATVTAP